ncbi:MAG: ABC transporter permease [Nitrospiria bacterium]
MDRYSFVTRMVMREMRSAMRHFSFFIFCISLGVAGIVAVSAISNQVENSILREAKSLLGGDIEIEVSHPISAAGLNVINRLKENGIRETLVYEMMAMAGNVDRTETQLVELKAVRPEYPLYGSLLLEPAASSSSFASSGKAWVENSLLIKLGLKPGDTIKLGQSEMTVAGVIKKEPDRITEAFSMGPRIIISESSIDKTGLIQPGSRVRYRYLLQLPPGMNPAALINELKETLKDEKASVESYQEAQPRLRRFLNNLTIYLGLIGLIALFIGGIGVGNSVHAYLKEKTNSMGILKCIGTTSKVLFAIYLSQALILGLLGSILGISFGLILHLFFQEYLHGIIPQAGEYLFPYVPILQGLTAGILVILLFSFLPLFKIMDLNPMHIFRENMLPDARKRKGKYRWISIGLIALATMLFTLWQAGNVRTGGIFLGIFLLTAVLLRLLAWALLKGAKRLNPNSFVLRYGIANLNRPGQFVQSVIFSIGLGTTVITAILFIRAAMIQQITSNIPDKAPTFFFIDIQDDQIKPFKQLVEEKYQKWGFLDGYDLNPILRARLFSINGSPITQLKNNKQWFYQREYVLTFRNEIPPDNRIIQGKWWTREDASKKNLISIEEDLARHLGVGIGSTLSFDFQGNAVEGLITNIRQVNWENLRTNFFIIFTPDAFEGRPVTYIATSRSVPAEDLVYQREVVKAFPNVTVINVRHILDTLREIMGKILITVQIMGGFTVAAGLVVLAGSMAATRYFRLKEAVILKMLGASRQKIAHIFIVEYTLMGFFAGCIGVFMGLILSLIFLKFILEIEWRIPLRVFPEAVIASVCLTTFISYFLTRQATKEKPMEILRLNSSGF